VAATIGIKIANGEFYSIVDENSSAKKRLILTTVHDNQNSVQIDLYKSYSRTMADAMYIGSLVVENIKPRPKGEPSIELVINSTADGNVNADAWDMETAAGEHQYMNVSLKSLDEDTRDYDIPDFELEEPERPPQGLYGKAEAVKNTKTKRSPLPVIIIAAVILIILCLGLLLFLMRDRIFTSGQNISSGGQEPVYVEIGPLPQAPAQNPVQPAPEQAQITPAPEPVITPEPPVQAAAEPAAPPPVIQAPVQPPAPVQVQRTRPVPPVRSYKVPATIPAGGANYTIRWGDTLWDIAEAFYRNPWLYPRIARFNNIRNPDLIISGRTIKIPPRN